MRQLYPCVPLFSSGIWQLAPGTVGDAGSANAWGKTWLQLSCRGVWDSCPATPWNARVLNPACRQLPQSFLEHPCFFQSHKNQAMQTRSWTEQHRNVSQYMPKITTNCQLILPLMQVMGSCLHLVRPALYSPSPPRRSGIPERLPLWGRNHHAMGHPFTATPLSSMSFLKKL